MGWRGILFSLIFFITLAESSSGSRKMWSLNIVSGSSPLYSWAVYSAGFFVLAAVVLSMYLIVEHLAAYNQPEEQKFLIGLILMVPVYALESYVNNNMPSEVPQRGYEEGRVYADLPLSCSYLYWTQMPHSTARSYVIVMRLFALYCFERYLIACLGGEESTIEFMESQSVVSSSLPLLDDAYAYGVVDHPFPLNCFIREWYLGSDFYQAVKIGIVQYMILKMICALLAMVFQLFGIYGEGKFEWRYAYPYLAVILNFSQTWALYCLVQFYSVTKNKLAPIKPLAKFLVVKSIVFLTWWQGIAVAFLLSFGTFKGSLAQLLKTRIQDYIICIEMGIAAVVHLYAFPAKPYRRGERCVRNVAVLSDYAALDTPPDPEEVQDCERSTRVRISWPEEREKRLKFHQSIRDVVVGSGEIIIDDMRFTVSHVAEPVERGIAKINRTFHQISENVKRFEEKRRNSKDDSYVVPLNSWTNEFSEVHDDLVEGSMSDSGMHGKRPHHQSKGMSSLRR